MNEEWRVVIGYPQYEVSDLGRVRSWTRWSKGRVLKNRANRRGGYLQVNLHDGHGGAKSRMVHQLVLEAFVGLRPEGYHGCHNNNIPTDNRISNLRWDTPLGNAGDRPPAEGPCRRGHNRVYRDHHRHCRACIRENYVVRASTRPLSI